MKLVVEKSNERIDKYLATNTEYSRSLITKMFQEEKILVNNKIVRPSYKVKENDSIIIPEDFVKVPVVKPVKMAIPIIYEDNDILIVDKPSGLVVHPGSGNFSNTLVNGLMAYTNNLSNNNGLERLGIVHRIDKDTSGLLIIAKTNKAHEILGEYFKNHTIKREYLALLVGEFPHSSATVDAPIGRDIVNRKKMCVTAKNSKPAITHLFVEKRYKGYTLVRLRLETGRTHQIRVHMNYIGYPVYNDPVYSNKTSGDFGQFLHSFSMDLIHPITKEPMHFETPLPKYFQDYLDTLEEY